MSPSAAETAPNRGEKANAKGSDSPAGEDRILCGHCGRTARNGISCIGMCVADSDY